MSFWGGRVRTFSEEEPIIENSEEGTGESSQETQDRSNPLPIT